MKRAATAALCNSGDVLRVMHWNVRRCVDMSGACSRLRLLQVVEQLQPALLTLNEVDMTQTPSLLEDLSAAGLPHASFFGHVRGVYGNVLASALPLRDVVHTHLDGGSQVKGREGRVHRISRGLVSASVSAFGVEIRVALTHLDHMKSAERRTQLRHVLATLDGTEQCLLLGDLNALSGSDYTAAEWSAHEAYNRANGWGAPVDDAAGEGVLALLRDASFVDAFACLDHPPNWRKPPWSAHIRDLERPPYRIDYVWSRAPSGTSGRRLLPLGASVVSECGEASDHQPLLLDFEAAAFDAGE